MNTIKDQMIAALANWVICVAKDRLASPHEIAALADVAKVVADYPSVLELPVK